MRLRLLKLVPCRSRHHHHHHQLGDVTRCETVAVEAGTLQVQASSPPSSTRQRHSLWDCGCWSWYLAGPGISATTVMLTRRCHCETAAAELGTCWPLRDDSGSAGWWSHPLGNAQWWGVQGQGSPKAAKRCQWKCLVVSVCWKHSGMIIGLHAGCGWGLVIYMHLNHSFLLPPPPPPTFSFADAVLVPLHFYEMARYFTLLFKWNMKRLLIVIVHLIYECFMFCWAYYYSIYYTC